MIVCTESNERRSLLSALETIQLILYAAESITIEAKQLLTTFMLNKSLNLYKFGDKLEPIYGCRVVGSSLVC